MRSIFATQALARRGTVVLRAKRAIEAMLETGRAYVTAPRVESADALVQELAAHGVRATPSDSPSPDARATRDALGLTQEQFAMRFGLDIDTVRNWESGRRQPDTAASSYLRAIAGDPDAIEAALWHPRRAAGSPRT